MKKIIYFIAIAGLFLVGSCKKTELTQPDPNSPNAELPLQTESGLIAYGAGILQRSIYEVPNEGKANILSIAMANQIIMGDEAFIPYGNFGWRWVDQVFKVTLPDNTEVINPFGVPQKDMLQSFNSRASGELNVFFYEWTNSYLFIQQANTMLKAVGTTLFTGDVDTKRATIRAWAYWWKGFSYSRLGSMYLAGPIVDTPAVVNHNFVDHNALIAEAGRNFDLCAEQLNLVAGGSAADYESLMSQLVLSFNQSAKDPNEPADGKPQVPSPDEWKHQLNSYKARNILVNKKVTDITADEWQQITTLATDGLKNDDAYFRFGMSPDASNDLSVNAFMHPLALDNPVNQYAFISERLVQDFKPGDNRYTRNILWLPYPSENPDSIDGTYFLTAFANVRDRGLQFGTRWAASLVEEGGAFASGGSNAGTVPYGTSYEENALMLAEANIYTNKIEEGLAYIDEVRDFQESGLEHVAGKGLTLDEAKEELRKERRIGLAFRGLSFFDARRWGITAPKSAGGGRNGAIVYVPASLNGTPKDAALPTFMEYNYMDYWDVPQNELDFNTPGPGSAKVIND